jgi:hypothetical protein
MKLIVVALVLALGLPAVAADYKTITWDALVPKDWDPMVAFKGMDLGAMKDGDPKADEMLKTMRDAWNNAPANKAIEGTAVRLPGYIVPLEETSGDIKEFLLVPYFGACIHSPPPPANQIVHVLPKGSMKGFRTMDTVWVRGIIQAGKTDSMMGTSGYRMEAVVVEKYKPPPEK